MNFLRLIDDYENESMKLEMLVRRSLANINGIRAGEVTIVPDYYLNLPNEGQMTKLIRGSAVTIGGTPYLHVGVAIISMNEREELICASKVLELPPTTTNHDIVERYLKE